MVNPLNKVFWIFGIILALFCCLQTLLFLRMAMKLNKKHDLCTKAELKETIKTSAIATIGPGINNLFLGISLCAVVGGGLTFMRCGIMGTPMFELSQAQYAAAQIGVTLGVDTLTESMWTYLAFAMGFAVVGYMISPLITFPGLDRATDVTRSQKKGQSDGFVKRLVSCITVNCLVYVGATYWVNVPSTFAYAASFIIALLLTVFAAKSGRKNLNKWIMLIAIVFGMVVGQVTVTAVG